MNPPFPKDPSGGALSQKSQSLESAKKDMPLRRNAQELIMAGVLYGAQPFVSKHLEHAIKLPQWTGRFSVFV